MGWRYASNLPHTSTHSQLHTHLPPSQPHALTPISSLSDAWGMLTSALDHTISGCLSVYYVLLIYYPHPPYKPSHTETMVCHLDAPHTLAPSPRCAFFPAYTPDSTTQHLVTPTPLYMGLSSHTASLVPRCPMIAPLCLLRILPNYPQVANQTRSQLLL